MTGHDFELENEIIRWDAFLTWAPMIERWLLPHLVDGYLSNLMAVDPKPHYIDDPIWVDEVLQSVLNEDVEFVFETIAGELANQCIHAFHGCRAKDASPYHEHGILLNDPEILAEQLRTIVREETGLERYGSMVETLIAEFDSRDRDTDRLYLTADERALVEDMGHYLIYGSEWIQCVLGWGAHAVLRERGVPTIVDVRLPLSTQSPQTRRELARKLLHEWARVRVEGRSGDVRDIDFSFILKEAVPSSWVLSHHHPKYVIDPFYQRTKRITLDPTCPACEGNPLLRSAIA